jgi:transposase
MEASKIAILTGINRNTTTRALRTIRKRIPKFSALERPFDHGKVETDESYFGAHRMRRVGGRGASEKNAVFRLI